jgi:L-lactate dehydrogenase
MTGKIMIIGAGSVGSTIVYALMIQNNARDIFLVDINDQKVQGEVLDLSHGLAFVSPIELHVGSYKDCGNMDVIIITAGAKQNPGENRIDLLNKNISIMSKIMHDIIDNLGSSKPIILIVSNPVDILTYFAQKITNYPKEKIFGSGTVLDTGRLRYEISNYCKIDARNIHGYIIGEHGDSEFALWSSLSIGNLKFEDFCLGCTRCDKKCNSGVQQLLFNKVKNAAYVIIDSKGFTNFGIGLAVSRIVESIVKNQHSILPVSAVLEEQYNLSDVALGIPCVLGNQGIERIVEVPMNENEQKSLFESSNKLKQLINDVNEVIKK